MNFVLLALQVGSHGVGFDQPHVHAQRHVTSQVCSISDLPSLA